MLIIKLIYRSFVLVLATVLVLKPTNMTPKIPALNSTVLFHGKRFRLIHLNLGGKCKLKKLDFPCKGSVLMGVDISEITIL